MPWHCTEKQYVIIQGQLLLICYFSNINNKLYSLISIYVWLESQGESKKTNLKIIIWKKRPTPTNVIIQKIMRSFGIFFIPFTP